MAEYIEKSNLGRKFAVDILSTRHSTIFDIEEVVNKIPTADVIERSKIDKAIEEMEEEVLKHKYHYEVFCTTEPDEERARLANAAYIASGKILEIIKRNMGK